MFRSVSEDSAMGVVGHAVVSGRRRTRAQARLEIHERRAQLKRTREAMEAAGRAAMATTAAAPQAADHVAMTPTRPVRPRTVVIGASFGENLAVEHTPVKGEQLQSPPHVRRTSATSMPATTTSPPRVHLPTPDKQPQPSPLGRTLTTTTTMTSAVDGGEGFGKTRKHLPIRGIGQSGSSSNRKRMISFSPERPARPVNEALERQKVERNLKATEKLELRLEGIPVRTPEKPERLVPVARRELTPSRLLSTPAGRAKSPSPMTAIPTTATPLSMESARAATPVLPRSETPASQQSLTMELQSQENPCTQTPLPSASRAPSSQSLSSNSVAKSASASPSGSEQPATVSSCKKELQFAMMDEEVVAPTTDRNAMVASQVSSSSQVEDVASSQDDGLLAPPLPSASQPPSDDDAVSCSVESGAVATMPMPPSASTMTTTTTTATTTTATAVEEAMPKFTSTSLIEDVGLFNCESDVEYTGGVYGEGTDGKVSAAVIRGQKVALKKAKPHEGFSEEEAKRRSAIELHYLRRVRHVPGFVQCLGLCDGIEHTCIALEVMDCKLSDYLRRHGIKGTSKRRFTLSFASTKALLKQICQPMIVLHEQVNVAHGDLACRNILVRMPPKGYERDWEPVVKLSDFGRLKTPSTEPPIFDAAFSFAKNADVGSFAREILYRLLVGEIVPASCTETRHLHKHLSDVVVTRVPDAARERLGPYHRLFLRCAGWGVRPSFREILEHLEDLEYFETTENGFFPLRPVGVDVTNGNNGGSTVAASASFLSPVADPNARARGALATVTGSASKNLKYETPSTATGGGGGVGAGTGPSRGPRLLPSRSFTIDGNGAKPSTTATMTPPAPKTVNWLKARSVHPGPLKPTTCSGHVATAPSSSSHALTSTPLHGARGAPTAAAALRSKRTPPSATTGASRRSLQILNQIQHRQHAKEKKQPQRG